MPGKVEICGVNTARLKVLSQKEMETLLLKAKNGDETARETLIEGNLRLVLSVIQRFDRRGESPDDLFQVGCIGLIKAISNFDPDKKVRFSTYGVPMIAGEVRRYLRDNSVTRTEMIFMASRYVCRGPSGTPVPTAMCIVCVRLCIKFHFGSCARGGDDSKDLSLTAPLTRPSAGKDLFLMDGGRSKPLPYDDTF